MFISDTHRFVFIHIHKTAGTSFQNFLKGLEIGEINQVDGINVRMHEALPTVLKAHPRLSEYFKFAIVRNPYDRLVSTYHWILQTKERVSHEQFKKFRDFDDYITQLYEFGFKKLPYEVFRRNSNMTGVGTGDPPLSYEDQSHYVFTGDGQCLADHLYRFEDLATDLQGAMDRIGLDVPLNMQHQNKSNHASFVSYYTDQRIADRVYEMYANDFKLLGYPRLVID